MENEFIQELIDESDDWNLPAKSTLITWISNVEDTSAEIKRAQLEGKPFIGIPQCLKKIGVKGSVEAGQDLRSIQHGLLTVGDTIVTAQKAKQEKLENERKEAAKKAANKRDAEKAATTAGKKPTKKKRNADEEDCDDGEDRPHKQRRRRGGSRGRKGGDSEGEEDSSSSSSEDGFMKDLGKLITSVSGGSSSSGGGATLTAGAAVDPGVTLAIEQARAKQADELTNPLKIRENLARMGVQL